MTKPALAALLFLSCSAPPDCDVGLPVWTDAVTCDVVATRVGLAREVLEAGGVSFAQLAETPVRVRPVVGWRVGERVAEGQYDVFAGITLSRGMRALVHELLHARDARGAVVTSAAHPGWDTNGYNDLDAEYRRRVAQLEGAVPRDLTCASVDCGVGERCEMHDVRCVRAPCPPQPVCVSE